MSMNCPSPESETSDTPGIRANASAMFTSGFF
jgi:hypothetical protein